MKITQIKEMVSEQDYNRIKEVVKDQITRDVIGISAYVKIIPEATRELLNYQRCKEMISEENYNKTIDKLTEDFLNGKEIRKNTKARHYIEDQTDLYLTFCLFPIKQYLTIPKEVRSYIGAKAQDFIDGDIKVNTFEEALYSIETTLRAFGNQEGADALGTLRVEAIDLESLRDEALNMMTHYED